jgi:low affinity Fe/Cu permease
VSTPAPVRHGRFDTACRGFARKVPEYVGSPFTFLASAAAVLAWVGLGPLFHWSGGWVLWPATLTSIFAFLLVILLQYSQNRDARVAQLKLDEIIRSLDRARTQLVDLENLSDEEIARVQAEFGRLRGRLTDGAG